MAHPQPRELRDLDECNLYRPLPWVYLGSLYDGYSMEAVALN